MKSRKIKSKICEIPLPKLSPLRPDLGASEKYFGSQTHNMGCLYSPHIKINTMITAAELKKQSHEQLNFHLCV